MPVCWNSAWQFWASPDAHFCARATGRLKAMHLFLTEKNRDFGLRFNSDVPSLLDTRTPQIDGNTRPFRLLSLPFYLIGQARRLCETALER
jgi:hypothetical protein